MTNPDTMTNEELRVAVAEVHGWTLGQPKTGQGAFHWRTEKKYMPGYNDQRPNFPTDVNAALTLCNALAERGWTQSLWKTAEGPWNAVFGKGAESGVGTGPTLPIAICRAYLAVIQSQTPTT